MFKELLESYEYLLKNEERLKELNGEEFVKGYKYGLYRLFSEIKLQSRFKPDYRNPTDEELQKYKREDGELLEMVTYREEVFPVYIDDYGQQEFAVIREKVIPGGSYNTEAIYDFCNYVDMLLM